MWPANAAYEGSREIARNNIIINAAEGGFGFYGCHDCTVVNNSVWITSGYNAVTDREFLRFYPSILEAGGDEYWGGSRRIGEVISNKNPRVINNLFAAAAGDVTCPMNASDAGVVGLSMKNNLWWNAGTDFPECGEGALSLSGYPDSGSIFGSTNPLVSSSGSFSVLPVLTPSAGSPLIGAGLPDADEPLLDFHGKTRNMSTPTIGAVEP